MKVIALVLLASWIVAVLVSRRRAAAGHPGAARWNAGLLLVTLLASMATCSAPIVSLIAGMQATVGLPPAERPDALEHAMRGARPVLLVAVLAIPLIGFGILQHARNRRRIQEARAGKDAA